MIDSSSDRAKRQSAWFGVVITIALALIVFTLGRLGPEYTGKPQRTVSANVVASKVHPFGQALTVQIPGEPAPVNIVMDDDVSYIGRSIDVVEIEDGQWYSAKRWDAENPDQKSTPRNGGLVELLADQPWAAWLLLLYAVVQIGWITGRIPPLRRP